MFGPSRRQTPAPRSLPVRPMIERLEERLVSSAAPANPPTASAAAAAPAVPLGGNLNQQTDRIQDHPFVDLVKVTRGFYNLAGRTDSSGATAPAATDANGWPTEDFAFSADDQSEYGVQVDPGTYHLSFTGPASVSVTTLANAPGPRSGPAVATNAAPVTLNPTGYDPATGVHTFDAVVPAKTYTLAFSFTNTAGQVKNIHLIQPGYDPNNYPVYTTKYLNLLGYLGPDVLRFMDFTQTNNNPDVNWSDRTLPMQPRGATNGVSWEDVITLADDLGKGVWINVPAGATDDYVTQLATLVKNTLTPGLPVYVEYSNEVWNYSFGQATYNKNQAVAEVQGQPQFRPELRPPRRHQRQRGHLGGAPLRPPGRAGRAASSGRWTRPVRMVLGGQAADLSALRHRPDVRQPHLRPAEQLVLQRRHRPLLRIEQVRRPVQRHRHHRRPGAPGLLPQHRQLPEHKRLPPGAGEGERLRPEARRLRGRRGHLRRASTLRPSSRPCSTRAIRPSSSGS